MAIATGRPKRLGLGAPAGLRVPQGASDERLVAAVRHGDAASFEAIYDRYAASMLGFCRHMLASASEAEDAVQETFASAYRALRNDSRDVELRPWLYAIARNRCLSVLRARRPVYELEDMGEDSDTLPELVARREDLRTLVEDVRRLPAQQRAALLLAELADMPHRELATVLGCRTEKVKALVFQARSTLIAEREARSISCREVREALAGEGVSGPGRAHLRRHLRGCEGCTDFGENVRHQRVALALALPVIPSAALKARTLTAGLTGANGLAAGAAGGSAAGGSFGTSVFAGIGKGVIAKALLAVGLLGAAGAGTVAITHRAPIAQHHPAKAASHARTHRAAAVAGGLQGAREGGLHGRRHSGRRQGATVSSTAASLTGAAAAPGAIGSTGHGHLAAGVSNGAANSGHATGNSNALAHGNGNKGGLSGGHRGQGQATAPGQGGTNIHSQAGGQHTGAGSGGSKTPASSGHANYGSSITPTTTGQSHTATPNVPTAPNATGVQQRSSAYARAPVSLPTPAAAGNVGKQLGRS